MEQIRRITAEQKVHGRRRLYRLAWWALVLACLGGGLALALVFSRSYGTLQAWGGRLAPDGDLESFTPAAYRAARGALLPLGIGLLAAAGLLVAFPWRSQAGLERLGRELNRLIGRLREDAARLVTGAQQIARVESRLAAGVAGLTLLAALLRALYLMKPMGHDETYTYMAFASQGLWRAISDYHLPNNHVFHTLLVLVTTQVLGDAPWAIRLPAFLFGVLSVPATALLALALYGRRAALLSAVGIAVLPVLIDYSSAARGYSGLAFFTVILLLLAVYVKKHANLAAWALFVLAGSLGFFTHPAMLYPFGFVTAWLFLPALGKDVGEAYEGRFVYYLIGAGAATAALTLALYTPLLIVSGAEALLENNFVEALSWRAFVESVPVRARNTWLEWNRGLPAAGTALFVAGLAAALVFGRGKTRHRVPIGLAALLWIAPLLVVQRVAPWPRVWLFLLPLFVMWAAAGWAWLMDWVGERHPRARPATGFAVALLVVLPLGWAIVRDSRNYLAGRGERGYDEQAALFLEGALRPDDVLLLTAPDAIVIRYYLERQGVAWDYAEGIKQKDFHRALAVVNTRNDQTVEWIVEGKSLLERVDLGTAQVVFRAGPLEVYAVGSRNSTK
jgi:hypothetical protein